MSTESKKTTKKVPLKKRLSYWFDNRMARGSAELIRLLAIVSLAVIALVALLVFIFQLKEVEFFQAFWDALSTIINGWMPAYEDGGERVNALYLVLMAATAIVGLLITSVLIGLISSALEEKINNLRRGNSEVIEEGHIVVLGFYAGEYTLLRQLILAAGSRPTCIVVASDMEQEEMQDHIRDNLEVPRNVRIVCRTADIFDPIALERCAVADCRSVIISPTDDHSTTKALLAVSNIINQAENDRVRVGAIVSRSEYQFPPSIAARHNVTTLQTNETLAKIIAHSCTQPGLSDAFREIFNFEGAELYDIDLPEAAGRTFESLLYCVDHAMPIGLCRNDQIQLNPARDTKIEAGDRILVFAEDKESAVYVADGTATDVETLGASPKQEKPAKVTVIGSNESLGTVLRELPENVYKVVLCDPDVETLQLARTVAIQRRKPYTVSAFEGNVRQPEVLERLAEEAEHIVILSDHEIDEDSADMDSIFLLLNLRDIRTRLGCRYNITAEMRREANQNLVAVNDNTDYVVASNMSSLFLAQLSESPELIGAFRELLSNRGNELYLKETESFGCVGEYTARELRRIALDQGYLFLGWLKEGETECVFDPPLAERIVLGPADQLVVIGRE